MDNEELQVHHMVRTITDYGAPGSITGEEADEQVGAWLAKGYKLVHVEGTIEAMSKTRSRFRAILLYIFVKDV